jgi:hypothetical protein
LREDEDGTVALVEEVIALLLKLRLRPRCSDDPTTDDRLEELILRLQQYVAAA